MVMVVDQKRMNNELRIGIKKDSSQSSTLKTPLKLFFLCIRICVYSAEFQDGPNIQDRVYGCSTVVGGERD